MKNPRKNARSFNSKPSENMQRGLLLAPPPLSYSYPAPHLLHNYQYQKPPPPLLPLPVANNRRNLSCPPTNKKSTRPRDQSQTTPKKSKQPSKRSEQESKTDFLKPAEKSLAAESLIFTSVNPLGPDPNDLPKNVSKILSAGIAVHGFEFDKFSGSGYTISPPPSSLPLPKFSLRPKLISCNAEAAGIDTGATDNLRRLLRLP